jgi:CRP-like cAMP-binding protein
LLDSGLLNIGRRTALERTAYLLLQLFVRAEEAGLTQNGSIQFPFTQQHLADTLGMSLVHTNKTLKRLFATGTVRWKDRVFTIIDRDALIDTAGENVVLHPARPFL